MEQTWVSVLNRANTSAGTALASSVTLTDINPTPNVIIPANSLQIGSRLEVIAAGKFSTTGTPTLLFGVYWGGVAGTVLCDIGATTTASAASNLPWRLQAWIDVRSIGSAGSMIAFGHVQLGTSLTAVTTIPMDNAAIAAVSSLDTTSAKALTVGAQWGTSSASNTVTCEMFMVKSLV